VVSAALATPVGATVSSYQVFVAGTDSSNGEAAVKVITMPAGTADTIDLGTGTGYAYGVAVNGSGTEAFATVGYNCDDSCDDYEVVPITGPFTFTSEGAFNGTVGTPVLNDLDGADFDTPSGITASGDVIAVLNDAGDDSGVYLFNDTVSSGSGSAADPDYAAIPYNGEAITANGAGLVAVAGQGLKVDSDPSGCETTGADEATPGCVWTFNVSPLTNDPTVTTALLDVDGSNVHCDGDTSSNNCTSVEPGDQGIVISPENGDIYVTDKFNGGVWQVDPGSTAPLYTTDDVVGFQYLDLTGNDSTDLEAITINGLGNTLYLSDGYDPHSYGVALSDYDVTSDADTSSETLTGSDTDEAYLLGIGLSPDGSQALVLDADDFDGTGTSYLDDIPTDAFTGADTQYDPPVGALGMFVTSATIASVSAPTTGAVLPLALAAALVLTGVAALGAAAVRRRRLA
jgi:hypothetical protein